MVSHQDPSETDPEVLATAGCTNAFTIVYVYWTSFNDAISNRFVLHVSDRWNHHLGCDPLESSPHSLQWGTLTKCGNSRTECTDLIWFAVVMVIQWYMFFSLKLQIWHLFLPTVFMFGSVFSRWPWKNAISPVMFLYVSLVCRWSQGSRCHGRRCQAELPEVCTEHMKERINIIIDALYVSLELEISCHVVEYYGSVNV